MAETSGSSPASPFAAARDRGWILAAVGAILALTAWRIALLPLVGLDLFVDDAQYWLWGKEPAWGYYSKPPLIGWILAVSTGLGGDGAFWIRLPLPLIHAATALVLVALGARLWDGRVGALAGIAFASLPAVSLGSLLLSTDTPLLLCCAVAIYAWVRLAEGASLGWAVLFGAAAGLGMLAKYSMVFLSPALLLAPLLLPEARIAWRDFAVAGIVGVAVVAPNVVWNLTHDFSTLRHTAENAGWEGLRLNPGPFAEFFAAQFGVAGPVVFAAYLVAVARVLRGGADRRLALMVTASLPVLVLVSGQALASRAFANWAAPTYAAGTVAAVAVLARHPRWLGAGLGINLLVALALPLAVIRPEALAWGGRSVFERQIGRHEVSLRVAALAEREGVGTVVARSRDFLADMFYTLRDSDLAIFAEPLPGPPAHHYAQRHPLPAGEAGEVLYVSARGEAPGCEGGATPREVARWQPERGFQRREIAVFRVDAGCWHRP